MKFTNIFLNGSFNTRKLRNLSFGKVIIASNRGNCLEAIVTKPFNRDHVINHHLFKKVIIITKTNYIFKVP